MLKVTVKHDDTGIFYISAEGHTGFAEAGSDIVCAAISTLMQALWVGLAEVLEIDALDATSDPDVPKMAFEWHCEDPSAQVLAKTTLISLKAVAKDYSKYVQVAEVFEV